jgi:hypothetical protein
MSLPDIDPDSQFFGNQDKLLSTRLMVTGACLRLHLQRRFSLRTNPDSMQVSEMDKIQIAPGSGACAFRTVFLIITETQSYDACGRNDGCGARKQGHAVNTSLYARRQPPCCRRSLFAGPTSDASVGGGSGPGLQDRLPQGCGSRAYREVLTACLAARGRMPRFSVVAEFQ